MVRDFQKRLSIKHGIITRKILDNNIELEGTPQDCIRIRYKKTKDGDTEAWELLMADIQSIYFPPLDEVPFRKLKDNGSVDTGRDMQNPWEQKLYKKKYIKKFIDKCLPPTS